MLAVNNGLNLRIKLQMVVANYARKLVSRNLLTTLPGY